MLRILPLVLSVSVLAQAQEASELSRPYFFSGPCSSQGMWTQQAMNLTNRIREVAIQLKNDPNCTATSTAMQKMLGDLQGHIKNAELGGGVEGADAAQKLSSLPQEIGALRTFMTGGNAPGDKKGLLNVIMKKAVEYSSIAAQQQGNSGEPVAQNPSGNNSMLLLNFGKRVQTSSYAGLKIFNGVIDTVAKNSQCLTGPQQGQFLAAAAATLATFASSGQDQLGNEIAVGVSKIGALGRELKFSKVFKTLNKVEFMNSMSCLMEITSESYCSARDGMNLYQEMNRQMKADALEKIKASKIGKDPSSPLAGYYVLTQHLPLFTNWLQKVQIGVDPKLLTDAGQQIKTLDKVNSFFTSVKRLQGHYNEQVAFIRSLSNPVAKKIRLIEMVNSLNNMLIGGPEASSSEFFTASVQMIEIPFRLLGIATPNELFDTNATLTFDRWIQNEQKWASIPNSGNPDLLAERIGENLNAIISSARDSAIIYYNRFFIVDKAAIYLDAILGTNYSVKDSLIAIDQYLSRLQKKINDYGQDQSALPTVIETRGKIGRVLSKFKAVQEFAQKMKTAPLNLPMELMENLTRVHFDFVKEVYDQFEVLLGRSGWLSNRLAKLVYYDYSMTLRNGTDLSPYFQELYYATGFAAYDKMIAMANGGPATIESDLKSATNNNKTNITALELLFKDNLVGMIGEQKLIADQTEKARKECGALKPQNFAALAKEQKQEIEGKIAHCIRKHEITPGRVYIDQTKRSFQEGYETMPGETTNPVIRTARGLWTSFKGLFLDKILGPFGSSQGKYDIPNLGRSVLNWNKEKISFDDETGSSRYLTARMCTQALAFNDLDTVWHLCKDVILESDFKLPLEKTQFAGMNEDYFKVNFREKAYENIEDPALNLSKRICAFRDYFRRNQVLYLTMGMQDTEKYQPEYNIEYVAPSAPGGVAPGHPSLPKVGAGNSDDIDPNDLKPLIHQQKKKR